jgi:uncharacterized protein (UPF0264 family)
VDLRWKESTLLLLISQDSVEEALECARAAEYLDIVDVKKPDEGSLGANFPWVIREIRAAVPADRPVSATVGDVPYKPGTVAQAALGAAVSGATYIKVGLYGCTTPEQAIDVMRGVVRAVKDYRPDAFVVASGYADAHRIGCVNPLALPDIAVRSGSDAAMLDTAIKDGTRLFGEVDRLSAGGSALAYEVKLDEDLLEYRDSPLYAATRQQIGIDLLNLFARQPRPDSAGDLAGRGWATTVRTPFEFTRRFGRGPLPEQNDALAGNRWVFANKPRR